MKYQQPYGVTDTNAPYVNGNPAIGQQGSIPPAAAFEFPQREIISMIANSGLGPTDDDLQQLLKSIRSQFVNYGNDAGVANQLGCGFTPPIDSYSLGMPFRIRVAATNTGASSFDAGAGRHPIKHMNGADVVAGDLPAGGVVEMLWDGTNFQMTNFLGLGGGGGPGTINNYNVKIPYIADTSSTANAIVAPFVPALTAVQAGDPIEVKIKNNVTGPTTIYVNALSPVPVINRFGGPLRQWDLVINEIVLMIYTGSSWQIVGQDPADAVQIFNTPGSYVWTCPNGVYFLKKAEVWGAGASGFNSTVGATSVSPGGTDGPGGNSGGYCCKYNMPVTPGIGYIVVVGAGGLPRNDNTANPGGYSTFGNTLTATGAGVANVDPMVAIGRGNGGDINLKGQSGILVGILTGVHGYIASYGWGAPAPRGGMGGGPAIGDNPDRNGQFFDTTYADGGWPGGGGGGGSRQPTLPAYANGHLPGKGGDGGVILTW